MKIPAGFIVMAVIINFAIFGVVSYVLMLLWNECFVPAVSGVHTVSWIQMVGIFLMCHWMLSPSNSNKWKNLYDKSRDREIARSGWREV